MNTLFDAIRYGKVMYGQTDAQIIDRYIDVRYQIVREMVKDNGYKVDLESKTEKINSMASDRVMKNLDKEFSNE